MNPQVYCLLVASEPLVELTRSSSCPIEKPWFGGSASHVEELQTNPFEMSALVYKYPTEMKKKCYLSDLNQDQES